MRRILLYTFLLSLFLLPVVQTVLACDSCGCSLARMSSEGKLEQKEKPVFFDFTFEQLVWHKRDAALAHSLHHQGHDTHVKTTEEFYHFGLGANPGEHFSFLAEMPYIVRHSIEVDDHAYLGGRQRSEGFGDLSLTGIAKLLKKENNFIGPLLGIKLPTGETTEKNKQKKKFVPELQPGSGSFDPSMGAAFAYRIQRISFHGNTIYTIRTRGAQDFRYGHLFSTYIFIDYLLNPASEHFQSKIGIDGTLHNEQRQHSREGRVADSGGTTLLIGPKISIQGNDHVSVFGNILFPAIQNLGGVHQQVQFVWNAGVKISF